LISDVTNPAFVIVARVFWKLVVGFVQTNDIPKSIFAVLVTYGIWIKKISPDDNGFVSIRLNENVVALPV